MNPSKAGELGGYSHHLGVNPNRKEAIERERGMDLKISKTFRRGIEDE